MIKAFALASLQAYIAVAADITTTTDVATTDVATLSSCGVENMTGWTQENKDTMDLFGDNWTWKEDAWNNPNFCCESKRISCDEWQCHCEKTGMQMLEEDFREKKWMMEELVKSLSRASANKEELKEESKRQAKKAAEYEQRAFECWWSDRNAGDGKCYNRDLEEKRQACWDKEDGSQWDWNTDVCMSKVEYEAQEQERCLKDDNYWVPEPEYPWCMEKSTEMRYCELTSSTWKFLEEDWGTNYWIGSCEWSKEGCEAMGFKFHDKNRCDFPADEAKKAESDYKKLMMAKYINLQATSTDETTTADETTPADETADKSESSEDESDESDESDEDDGIYLPGDKGYCEKTYSSPEECDCYADFDAYLFDFTGLVKETEWPVYDKGVCYASWDAFFDQTLFLDLDLKSMDLKKKQAIRAMRSNPRALMSVAGKISGPTVADIYAPVAEGEKQGEELAGAMGKDLEALAGDLQQWGKQWEEFGNAQNKRQEEAFGKLAEYLFDSVTVDGKTLRDTFGNPEDLMNPQKNDANKEDMPMPKPMPQSARSMLKEMTTAQYEQDLSFSFDIPAEAEIDAFLSAAKAQFRNITGSLESVANEYYPQYVTIEDAVLETVGTIAEDQVGAQVNRTGDFVKSIVDTLDYKLEDISLAQTHAQAESSNTGAYAGAAFGVIGLAATLALVSTCNKKAVQQNQEALL